LQHIIKYRIALHYATHQISSKLSQATELFKSHSKFNLYMYIFCTSVSGTVKTKTQLALWTAASHFLYISQWHCEDKDSVGIMNSSISHSVHQSAALWRQRLSWHYEQQHLTFRTSVSGTVKTKTQLALWTAASHVLYISQWHC